MANTLNQPNHIISLSTSAVLVSIDINIWNATKSDKTISDEVTRAKKAEAGAGRFVKNLLNNNAKHKAVTNYRQTVYNWLKLRTYRWNNSQDLLPAQDLAQFKQEWAQHETQFHILLNDFISDYDSIVSNMAFSQGDMFNKDDYLPKDEIRRKFGAKLFISEVPTNDFRCTIANDLAQDLHDTYTKQTESIMESIQNEQAERLVTLLKSISHTFTINTDSNGKETRGKVYDSTIDKTKELASLYRTFNVANNPLIAEVVKQLESTLANVTADTIRASDTLRKNVKNDVDDILTKFSTFQCV